MKLIAGVLNNTALVRYWSWEFGHEPKCGNYAIVENLKDYALVKIVGIVETDTPKLITNGHKVKRAVLSVPTSLLELADCEQIEPAQKFLQETDLKMYQYNEIEDFFKEK